MLYDNFVQVRYYNKAFNEWRKGIAYKDRILDYKGFAVELSELQEDQIVEIDWRALYDSEDVKEMFEDNNISFVE